MFDERCLTDLINSRFDDTNARIDALKADMLRHIDDVKNQQAKHETEDTKNFASLAEDIKPLKNMKMTVAGAASAAFVVIQAAAEVLKHYLR